MKLSALALATALLATSAAAQQTPADAQEPSTTPDTQQPSRPQQPSTPTTAPAEAERPSAAAQPPADAQQAPFADRAPSMPQRALGPGGLERPVMAVAGGSVAWDSNVFRLPNSADAQSRLGRSAKSDRIGSAYAGVRVDQPYAQQRFRLDVTQTAYRYQNFSFLDFDALRYSGDWYWHLTPRLSGTIGFDHDEGLVSFADFRDTSQRNVRTTENRRLSADALLFGGWHLLGSIRQVEAKTSVPFVQLGSTRGTASEAGVRYVGAAGNVGFNLRRFDTRFTDRPLDPVMLLDDRFRRTESEVLATWVITGRSAFDGRLARVEHRSGHFAERNFSGTAAGLIYRWRPTGRLTIGISAARDFQPWSDVSASYRVDERLAFEPAWEIGGRSALRASLARATSKFRNPLQGFTGPLRRDVLRIAQVAFDWRLPRNLIITAALTRQKQASTDELFTFDTNLTTLGISLMF
jgi:exopolysaccharide biosynthesis operon protein EpsL